MPFEVKALLRAHPEAAWATDAGGQLPLHTAVKRSKASSEVTESGRAHRYYSYSSKKQLLQLAPSSAARKTVTTEYSVSRYRNKDTIKTSGQAIKTL